MSNYIEKMAEAAKSHKSSQEIIYKVLGYNGEAYNGGNGSWNLPVDGAPGAWMPRIKKIMPCVSGYHLCRRDDLMIWLGPTIWIAEWRGEMIEEKDKIVVSEARIFERVKVWNERVARLFAADCAERVLPLYEKRCPNDDRPRKAIEATRAFARGEISAETLKSARDSTWDAPGHNAVTVARAASTAYAWAAARTAARTAAFTVKADAVDAERQWQTDRLFQYLDGDLS